LLYEGATSAQAREGVGGVVSGNVPGCKSVLVQGSSGIGEPGFV
jgi:hypothetical protein